MLRLPRMPQGPYKPLPKTHAPQVWGAFHRSPPKTLHQALGADYQRPPGTSHHRTAVGGQHQQPPAPQPPATQQLLL